MMDLPEFLSPPPEKEAVDLALSALVFGAVKEDAERRKAAMDTETPALRAYLLLDASISPDIAVCVQAFSEEARCLFDGAALEDLGDVGPWLVELREYGDTWDWYLDDGYGHNWGLMILSRLPMAKLKTQLKKFIKITDDEGQTYFFKFYRPQHLNTYLPAFDDGQKASFMRGIEAILAESHGRPETVLRHSLGANARLDTEATDLVAMGLPLRTQPASRDEVDAILALAAGDSIPEGDSK